METRTWGVLDEALQPQAKLRDGHWEFDAFRLLEATWGEP